MERGGFDSAVLRATGAGAIVRTQLVQSLWGGYGQLVRCHLDGAAAATVIVKHVCWPDERSHPRGWTSDISHERKVRSYQVESAWYESFAPRCPETCRVPRCLAIDTLPNGVVIVLEDLDAAGFPMRRHHVNDAQLDACISWLANFHATFLFELPDGLWPTGTYWHLATRPEELEVLDDGPLKKAAAAIDRRLSECRHQTLVHGDAKLANFCFARDGRSVAAVDFQYVGGGCGMKDIAYFISSCLDEDESERRSPAILDRYFTLLREALKENDKKVDADALEEEWRALYPVAWTDFYRFLQGWCPGHWKIHKYSERLAREVLDSL